MNSHVKRGIVLILLLISTGNLNAQQKTNNHTDYHVHLQDSDTKQLGYRMAKVTHQKLTRMDSLYLDADTIIHRLDKANFHSAWIISNAYWFGSPLTPVKNEYDEVKKQNDWIATQAARYPDRLKAFMSVNPLKPYALKEIERCAATKLFTGLKLHFANSRVNLFNKAQVKQLQKIFAAADKYHLAMLVHFRSGQKWDGAANTRILVEQLLPYAKKAKIVIAHSVGWGGYDRQTDKALGLIAAYVNSGKTTGRNLYLDVSAVFPLDLDDQHLKDKGKVAFRPAVSLKKRIKQIGVNHFVFGTDWPLIDIEPYIGLLDKNLGKQTTQRILNAR